MATTLNLATPGVYIQEIPVLPASIVSVPTAVPVFVGYTEKASQGARDLSGTPFRIESFLEYQEFFGGAWPETGIVVKIDDSQTPPVAIATVDETKRSPYLMYYSMQMFYGNGGGICYILSIGKYNADNPVISSKDYLDTDGLTFAPKLEKYPEITLVVCPDALDLPHVPDPTSNADTGDRTYYGLMTDVINHCIKMQNRMAVMDVYPVTGDTLPQQNIDALRNNDGSTNGLSVSDPADYKFGAAYFPRIFTSLLFSILDPVTQKDNETLVKIILKSSADTPTTLAALKSGKKNQLYFAAKNSLSNLEMLLPAAPAVVGVYSSVDNSLGVWNAPANRGIIGAVDLEYQVSATEQASMNVDPFYGLSVNVIRSFPGRGPAIIWGARTLAGNDNEWRYVPVRRYFFMVEQSIKNATESFVFSPNDENTWTRVKAMIGNYLLEQLSSGALMGPGPKNAFYVRVGLGETMSEMDVLEGRMIVQIGLAVVRPAEFIILQFMQLVNQG